MWVATASNFVIDGREIIGLRGYQNNSITPAGGGALYNKYILEARYIIANTPSAQVFPLVFLEAGNNYDNFWDYRAFNLKEVQVPEYEFLCQCLV